MPDTHHQVATGWTGEWCERRKGRSTCPWECPGIYCPCCRRWDESTEWWSAQPARCTGNCVGTPGSACRADPRTPATNGPSAHPSTPTALSIHTQSCLNTHRIHRPVNRSNPLEEVLALGEGRYALLRAHHQHHQLLLQAARATSGKKTKISSASRQRDSSTALGYVIVVVHTHLTCVTFRASLARATKKKKTRGKGNEEEKSGSRVQGNSKNSSQLRVATREREREWWVGS